MYLYRHSENGHFADEISSDGVFDTFYIRKCQNRFFKMEDRMNKQVNQISQQRIDKYKMKIQTRIVILVSVMFLTLLTAYNAFSTIITRVRQEQGNKTLSPFYFTINAVFFLLFTLVGPLLTCSEKWQMAGATLCYLINYSTGFIIFYLSHEWQYVVTAAGAIINAFGSAILYVAGGRYIHQVCALYGADHRKGHLYGLFNSIYSSSGILGGVVVTVGLDLLSHQMYFALVACISAFAFVIGVTCVPSIPHRPPPTQPIIPTLIKTIKFYPRMVSVLPYILLDGFGVAVSGLTMLHLIPLTHQQHTDDLNSGIALIIFGFGCALGGYCGGRFCDLFSISKTCNFAAILFLLISLLSILASWVNQLWLAWVVCCCWGYILYYIEASEMVVCSRVFHGNVNSFVIVKQFHCVSMILYDTLSVTTANSIPIVYLMLGLIAFALLALFALTKLPKQSSLLHSQLTQVEEN